MRSREQLQLQRQSHGRGRRPVSKVKKLGYGLLAACPKGSSVKKFKRHQIAPDMWDRVDLLACLYSRTIK